MENKKFNIDVLNILIAISFTLAIVFYILSGKLKDAVVVFFLLAVLCLLVGVVCVVIKLFRTFLVTYQLYKVSVKEKRLSLYNEYGPLSQEAEAILKDYKKNYLRSYRLTNYKYVFIISTLIIIALYILYLGISVLSNLNL
ncbi:MAG: hypothetical protein IJZ29_03860 [Clostridia bacterium]|nr:hypothetical protein [Clostridia bacterium]